MTALAYTPKTLPTSRSTDPDLAPPPTCLRLLAGTVERLNTTGRLDPERILLAKAGIAHQLRRLARELEA